MYESRNNRRCVYYFQNVLIALNRLNSGIIWPLHKQMSSVLDSLRIDFANETKIASNSTEVCSRRMSVHKNGKR